MRILARSLSVLSTFATSVACAAEPVPSHEHFAPEGWEAGCHDDHDRPWSRPATW